MIKNLLGLVSIDPILTVFTILHTLKTRVYQKLSLRVLIVSV